MGKQCSRQLQDGRGFVKDGSVVGDRHTQRYKMIGNGWTIAVIAHILKHISN